MPDRVEALALGVEARRLELGVEDALLVVERAGEVRAVRGEDRAAAPADDLVSFEQLSEREMADALGCPSGTVKSRLARATQRLRDELARAGADR